jgi:FkbM family methyltransferase
MLRIDVLGDNYGLEFWKSFESGNYEPDTLKFLETRVNSETVFLDIGAANGALTLLGAALGATVRAYEPHLQIFTVLKRNIELNSNECSKVEIYNCGISNEEKWLEFGKESDRSVFSEIVTGNESGSSSQKIRILSLSNELRVASSQKKKVIIKMDIEGAEWKIINDKAMLQSMKDAKVTMLLALHPGFYRKQWISIQGLKAIFLATRRIQNFLESLRTFDHITKFAAIQRTNLNPVPNRYRFAFLVFAGYYEFILEF